MNGFEKYIVAIQKVEWAKDKHMPYGWFDLVWIFFAVILLVFCGVLFRNKSDRVIRIVLIVCSSIMLFNEIYKQFIGAIRYDQKSNTVHWEYEWFWFPFQFCSTPMYVGIIAGFICKGKIQKMLYNFLGFFGMFGGVITFLNPGTILATTVLFIIFHSLIHHLLMMVMAVTLLVSKIELNHKAVLWALPVFAVLVVIADVLNVWFYYVIDKDGDFNMFYISPYKADFYGLAFTKWLIERPRYALFIILYLLGFSLIGYIISLLAMFMKWCLQKIILLIREKKCGPKYVNLEKIEKGECNLNDDIGSCNFGLLSESELESSSPSSPTRYLSSSLTSSPSPSSSSFSSESVEG